MPKPASELRAILADAASDGAIVAGPAGSGRRVVFDEALAQLSLRPPVVHLNGSSYTVQKEHGVLTFLLSQLADEQLATRHELVHGLADLLCSDGLRTIVTLGSPEMIDAESAAILTQLAEMRKIWLVAVCEGLTQLPEDILALHRSGHLPRVAVHPMGVVQARSYLETEVGGPISMFAASALWHLSNSNRDVLRQLVRELVAHEKLRLEGGCWVFAPGSLRVGPTLTAQTLRSLAGLGETEQHLLSTLALGGPVASEDVRRAGLHHAVGTLRSRGLVTVIEAPAGTVALTVPLHGHLLRDLMDEDKRQEVETTLASLHAHPLSARVLTEVQAMKEFGNIEALVALVDEFAEQGGFSSNAWRADAVQQLAILKLDVEALCAMGRHERAGASLKRAAVGVSAALRVRPDDFHLVRAAQLLRLMSARMALVKGRPEAVWELLSMAVPSSMEAVGQPAQGAPGSTGHDRPVDGVVVGTIWATESLHFTALAVQAEAWAMTSRQREALLVVQRVLTDIEGLRLTGVLDQVMSASECAEIERSLLRVQLLSGEWRAARVAARRLAGGQYADADSISYGEFIIGLLAAFTGEADMALGVLLPTLQQFGISADPSELAAAEAATAYCLADQDRVPEALDLLLRTPSAVDRRLPLNFFTWASEVFSSLAVARIDSPQGATVRLVALAEKVRRAERPVLEMNALAVALRLGRTDVAPRLQTVCESVPGPSALAFSLLARGAAQADPLLLAEGLEELAAQGQALYAAEDSNMLLGALGHKERRRVFAAVARSRGTDGFGPELEADTATPGDERPLWLDQLTKRETQVAQRVIAGMTNLAIARMSGVSVRTVEGHLYQVYSKLQVRNRQELAALDRASRRTVGVR